jgi:hypothetical protein
LKIVGVERLTKDDQRRFAAARRRGRRHAMRPTAVVSARYDPPRDEFQLTLRNGDVRRLPRQMISELRSANADSLQRITVSAAGDVIAWRELDVDVSSRTLLRALRAPKENAR